MLCRMAGLLFLVPCYISIFRQMLWQDKSAAKSIPCLRYFSSNELPQGRAPRYQMVFLFPTQWGGELNHIKINENIIPKFEPKFMHAGSTAWFHALRHPERSERAITVFAEKSKYTIPCLGK